MWAFVPRTLPQQRLPLYPDWLWNGSSLAAGFGSGRKVRHSRASDDQEVNESFFLVTIICARVASFPSAGIMLTARLPSHSSELSTSADAASCSERTPSVALSQGCAGSTWSCAVSCWPCATGRCLSRAASGPAACVAPVPRWTAWRSDSMKRDRREERIGRNVVGDGI